METVRYIAGGALAILPPLSAAIAGHAIPGLSDTAYAIAALAVTMAMALATYLVAPKVERALAGWTQDEPAKRRLPRGQRR